jgi:hypothetical protein
VTGKYRPPEQGRAGQIVDTVFILLLVFAALFLPLRLGLTGAGTVPGEVREHTWEALGQNATMQAQWEKLGHTPATAAKMITSRFDYTIRPVPLVLTFLVIGGYFALVFAFSEKEYREVIRERFGVHDATLQHGERGGRGDEQGAQNT